MRNRCPRLYGNGPLSLFHTKRYRRAAVHRHQRGQYINNGKAQHRHGKCKTAHLNLKADKTQHIHDTVEDRKKWILHFQALRIGLEDIVKAEVMHGEQH